MQKCHTIMKDERKKRYVDGGALYFTVTDTKYIIFIQPTNDAINVKMALGGEKVCHRNNKIISRDITCGRNALEVLSGLLPFNVSRRNLTTALPRVCRVLSYATPQEKDIMLSHPPFFAKIFNNYDTFDNYFKCFGHHKIALPLLLCSAQSYSP